jgi:DNA invertase Pin-like site-specific DNA recombinase
MEKPEVKISPDLQRFIEKFEPNKFKLMPKGIEIRGISDLHRNMSQAKDLIERLRLKLIISHNAEMVSYGGFEVNNL